MKGSTVNAPKHLRFVALLVLLPHGWGMAWSLWYLFTGEFMQAIDIVWLVGLVAAVLGAVALLLRRKEAAIMFAAVILAAVVSFAVPMFPGAGEMWLPVVVANGGVLLVGGGLSLLYSRAMARRGVLR